jgi:hypothetical protein
MSICCKFCRNSWFPMLGAYHNTCMFIATSIRQVSSNAHQTCAENTCTLDHHRQKDDPNPNPRYHFDTSLDATRSAQFPNRSMFEHTTEARLNIGKNGQEWRGRRCPAFAANVRSILPKQRANANHFTEAMNPPASIARPHITTRYPTSPCPKARTGTTSSSSPTCTSRA